MSDDRLARWREFLKDPIRQKILLKLGQQKKLSFDELMKEAKINDQMQLYNELQILRNLVSKAKSENYQIQQEVGSEDISERYVFTEEGQDVVDWMIAFQVLAEGKLKTTGWYVRGFVNHVCYDCHNNSNLLCFACVRLSFGH